MPPARIFASGIAARADNDKAMRRNEDYTPLALSVLQEAPNGALDDALVDALVHTHGPVRGEYLKALLKRGRATVLGKVIGRFGSGDDDLDRRLIPAVSQLESAIRALIQNGSTSERLAAVALLEEADEPSVAYLLGDLVARGEPKTQEAAAEALCVLTTRLLMRCSLADSTSDAESLRKQTELLASAFTPVFQCWELHMNRACMTAGLWLGHHVRDAVAVKLAQVRNGLDGPIRRVLSQTSDPRLAGFLIAALSIPEIRATTASTIARCRDLPVIEAIVERADRLRDDAIRHGCKFVKDTGWLALAADSLLGRGDHVMSGVVDFLAACGGPTEQKLPIYRRLLNGCTPAVRRRALRAAVEDLGRKAMPLLTPIALRDDELAASAVGMIPAPSAAPGTPVRRETPAARYFRGLLPLTREHRDAIIEDLKRSPGGALVALRAKLTSPNALDKARALHLARSAGLLPELAQQVYRLVHDHEPAVRSVAVAALVRLPGATAQRLARSGADDADERVRAGAVEAMDQLGVPDRATITAPFLDSRDQRLRANAVKSLLRLSDPRAAETLLDMLEDPSPAHRLSGLWVVERMNLGSTARTLRKLARDDRDDRIRARAVTLLRRFEPLETGHAGALTPAVGSYHL